MKFFDAHTHVQFAAFEDDYKEAIIRAIDCGVGVINVGTQKNTSRRAVEIAHEFERESVRATVGLHPIHTSKSFHDAQELGALLSNSRELESRAISGDFDFVSRGEEFDYDYYKKLALDEKVAAIGECGLDYAAFVREQSEQLQKLASANLSAKALAVAEALSEGGLSEIEIEKRKEKQKETFIKQIELAREIKKPLMIHCRDAYGDLIDVLSVMSHKLSVNPPGIIHFFSGTEEEAKKLLDMGFYFTFGGVVTFPPKRNGVDYVALVKLVPMARILSETDAPYVAPVPYRGKRNEPAYVVEVVKKLAEIKNVSLDTMRGQILENTKRAFGIDF